VPVPEPEEARLQLAAQAVLAEGVAWGEASWKG